MKNYDIIKTKLPNTILVLIYTCESPFDYLDEIMFELKQIDYTGTVIFDCLLHSGNNEERFISCEFDGNEFVRSTFKFLTVKKQDELRRPMCVYLRNDRDFLHSSGLTTTQIKLIEKECVI